jgi:Tol biopolymer transport system component
MLRHLSVRYLIWPLPLLGLGCGGGDVQAPPTTGPSAKIAFVNQLPNTGGIYLMNPDGTEERQLTSMPIYTALRWSADRSKIVFDGGPTNDVYVINADGTGERQLTNTFPLQLRGRRNNEEQFPTISPDGSRIAFEADLVPITDFANSEIYVVNPDGTGLTNLTNKPGGDFRPAWSPDGSKIAYIGSNRLWVMNADGSGPVQISGDGFVEREAPTWSPDGRMLAFLVIVGDIYNHTGYELHVISADGSGERSIVTGNILSDPTWSPDGTRIVYEEEFQFIVVINPDGSNRRQLTGGDLRRSLPVWSPDGTRLAYTVEYPPTASDRDLEIGVMEVASGAETIVTHYDGHDFHPAWAP